MNRLNRWTLLLASSLLVVACGKENANKPTGGGGAAKAAAVAKAAGAEAAKTAKVSPDGVEAKAAIARAAAKVAAAKAEAGKAGAGSQAEGKASNVPSDWSAVLKNPGKATAKAPKVFKVKFTTAKGDFSMTVHREWAPKGVDRFYNLVKAGFFTDIGFFRNIDGFMVQFGVHGDPVVNAAWRPARMADDPVKQSNKLGYVTFATSGKDSRTTQIFINYKDNSFLDRMGFTPFAQIDADGMAVVNKLYKGYGEGAPRGKGPDQGRLQREGNTYLKAEFPLMDFCKSAEVLDGK